MTSPITTFPLLKCHKIHLRTSTGGKTMQQKPIEGYINSTQEHTLKDSKMEKKKKIPQILLSAGCGPLQPGFPTQGKPEMKPPVQTLYWETLSPCLNASLGG